MTTGTSDVVSRQVQHHGIGTVLPTNWRMPRVFQDLGLDVAMKSDFDAIEVCIDLAPDNRYLDKAVASGLLHKGRGGGVRLGLATEKDVRDAVSEFAPRLFKSTVDKSVARDVLVRVAKLAEALPEVTELDINPLVVGENGGIVVDARVRVAPTGYVDLFLRRMR
ncbi:acetate--CoA ligase family protein [Actinocrispum wychmicini]|uniref:ATP-grasp domain-containing protein n=1 Tax=Actinocrispum wychmicini TaxID=1213861 RepID=A0A4R2JXP6_9PSEU|nr:acetate--CoA ligase family protein [Actinocrispum wychmicini]TCO61969.1 ATP-grasp domain-containing protein [Actinocrispum wychmicini]